VAFFIGTQGGDMTQALDGLRVLDFTRVLAGPFCTMMLGDYGADVIKVEQPGRGDDTREWGPPWAGDLSAYFLSVNRNKRSITLNLKTAEGQSLARQLALRSDVVIENFKVGQMQQFGLDYASLRAANPGLVYCSITGYGQDSPYAQWPGYDFVIQGQSGLMSITGPEDGPPYKVGVAISDVLTGLTAANAIQAALRHRDKTGQGQAVDVALLDSQIAGLVNVLSSYLVAGTEPERVGNAHASIVPYEMFEAADKPFIMGAGNNIQFGRLCDLLRQPQLATDPRFATNPARVQNREALLELLRALFAEQPAQVWIDALLAAGIPAGPLNTIPEMIADPHVQARGLVESVTLTDGTPVDLMGPAARLSATPATIRLPPPLLGQDTDAVLQDVLGMDVMTITDYRARGII
jgi:crotonobetainyl-CoA:carnitine CoA-transferase CaiB-like acyl-CoA transferase